MIISSSERLLDSKIIKHLIIFEVFMFLYPVAIPITSFKIYKAKRMRIEIICRSNATLHFSLTIRSDMKNVSLTSLKISSLGHTLRTQTAASDTAVGFFLSCLLIPNRTTKSAATALFTLVLSDISALSCVPNCSARHSEHICLAPRTIICRVIQSWPREHIMRDIGPLLAAGDVCSRSVSALAGGGLCSLHLFVQSGGDHAPVATAAG